MFLQIVVHPDRLCSGIAPVSPLVSRFLSRHCRWPCWWRRWCPGSCPGSCPRGLAAGEQRPASWPCMPDGFSVPLGCARGDERRAPACLWGTRLRAALPPELALLDGTRCCGGRSRGPRRLARRLGSRAMDARAGGARTPSVAERAHGLGVGAVHGRVGTPASGGLRCSRQRLRLLGARSAGGLAFEHGWLVADSTILSGPHLDASALSLRSTHLDARRWEGRCYLREYA